jgi:chromosome segregation ATPase
LVSDTTGRILEAYMEGKDAPPQQTMNAYEEILKMISETESEPMAKEVEKLKARLVQTQERLATEKKRADNAEMTNVDLRAEQARKLAEERRRTEAIVQSSKTIKKDLQKALEQEQTRYTTTNMQLATVRDMLDDTNVKHTKELARANAAETKAEDLGNALTKRDSEWKALRCTLGQLEAELKTSKDRCQVATSELETQGKELEAVKTEANTVKAQMNTVRDKMKKSKGAGAGKRQADTEESEARGKKVKTEE